MTNEQQTPEQAAASAAYNRAQRHFEKVHLAWQNGEATIEQDRAADEGRRAALAECRRLGVG